MGCYLNISIRKSQEEHIVLNGFVAEPKGSTIV